MLKQLAAHIYMNLKGLYLRFPVINVLAKQNLFLLVRPFKHYTKNSTVFLYTA